MTSHPLTVPVAGTAVRTTWTGLPASVRALIEGYVGGQVVHAESQDSGFTPGFASLLTLADGRRAFVKAADEATQPVFTASYREEVRKVTRLPAEAPVPRLLWSHEADGWVLLGFEAVDGRPPARPWRTDELTRVVECVGAMASVLTPAPDGLALPTWADAMIGDVDRWVGLRHDPAMIRHGDAAAALACDAVVAGTGDSLVHCDLRDDNILVGAHDVWICDWNWPVRGAAWIDLLTVLLSARGDGHDVDAILALSPVTTDVPRDDIDAVLALLTGYFFTAMTDETPSTSPWIRIHQRWYAEVTWAWLRERRGWT
ncbi:MAG: phosphotransferase [Nocardioidaceae bacterium]